MITVDYHEKSAAAMNAIMSGKADESEKDYMAG